MKKFILLPLLSLIVLTYFACQRTDSQLSIEKFKDPFANEAAGFVKSQVTEAEFESLDLNDYSIMKNEKGVVGVRFLVKGSGGKQFALVGKTDKEIVGNWVDISQLSSGSLKEGTLTTKSFSGDKIVTTTFANNRVVKTSQNMKGKIRTGLIRYSSTGDRIMSAGTMAVARIEGEDDQWLPSVTVTSYIYSQPTNFYSLFYYFNYNTNYTYTYQTTDPGTYGYGGGGAQVVNLQAFEFLSGPAANLQKLMNCFNSVPTNSSTKYSLTLHADIPDNNDPNIVAVGTTPGHAFVTLTKTNGTTSVSQTFGFYPVSGAKSISFAGVDSKIVNDKNHQYDASITISLPENEFNIAKNQAINTSTLKYDLNDNNCTDYAVGIFNSVMISGVSQLNVPDFITPAGINYKTTPNGLYKLLKEKKFSNDPIANNIILGNFEETAGGAECN